MNIELQTTVLHQSRLPLNWSTLTISFRKECELESAMRHSRSFRWGATRGILHIKRLVDNFPWWRDTRNSKQGWVRDTVAAKQSVHTRASERGPRHSSRPLFREYTTCFVYSKTRRRARSPCGRSDATRPAPLTRLLRICTQGLVGSTNSSSSSRKSHEAVKI